jgi:hypothetical protein
VRVLASLDARAQAVAGVENLVHEALGHGLLATGAGVRDEPAQRERVGTAGLDLDRHLVGRATDAAAADLEGRLHVVERALERDDRVVAGLDAATLEGVVHGALGDALLAVLEHLVHQLGDQGRGVDGIDDDRPLRGRTLARH